MSNESNIDSIKLDFLETIANAVGIYYSISLNKLFKRSRKRVIVQKRQTFMALARDLSNLETPMAAIGNYALEHGATKPYNHATVLFAANTINNLITTDKSFKREYEEIKLLAENMLGKATEFQTTKSDLIKDLAHAKTKEEVQNILENEHYMSFFGAEDSILV
jgi:hypothetical protein